MADDNSNLISNWTKRLNVSTEKVETNLLREIISHINHRKINIEIEVAFQLIETIFSHLKCGFDTVETQSLCSSVLLGILVSIPESEQQKNLNEIFNELMQFDITFDREMMKLPNSKDKQYEIYISCLINSIYQSDLFTCIDRDCLLKKKIVKITYLITIKSCIRYTHCTFAHFRNLHLIVQKIKQNSCLHETIEEDHVNILHTVFHNWNNPITGVRDINAQIFSIYIETLKDNLNQNLLDQILNQVSSFPWNKTKYLALSVLVPHIDFEKFMSENKFMIIRGLELSLEHTNFVSSGCNLYKAILKRIKSVDGWVSIFLKCFERVLCESTKDKKKFLFKYWLPPTLKEYPTIVNILIESLSRKDCSVRHFEILSLIKFGKKMGLLLDNLDDFPEELAFTKKMIDEGLINIDEDVRCEAIQIISTTHRNTDPTLFELQSFKTFYTENINHDSTSFRQNNLNCFTNFLIRLGNSCLSNLRTNNIEGLNHIKDFFIWLHNFIIHNLSCEGNYQRKILALNMCNIILQYMNNECKKKTLKNKDPKSPNARLAKFLIDEDAWSFDSPDAVNALIECVLHPTNDIRERAADIIIKYYTESAHFINNIPLLFSKGIDLSNSKLFYENENGCLLLRTIIHYSNASRNSQLMDKLTSNSSYVGYFYEICEQQFNSMKTDILLAINDKKPLHGMLSALNEAISHSPLSPDLFDKISSFIKNISDYFIDIFTFGAKEKEFPPSFSQMSESIELLIKLSTIKYDQNSSSEKISNGHQLVLNNIWLNLKICCKLSITLIEKCTTGVEDKIKDCLQIFINILTKCRHKGAIESAGTLLGHSIRHITSKKSQNLNNMLSNILFNFLEESTSTEACSSSVTRRSAGLTILVHQMVSNDMSDNKCLYYLVMRYLLDYLTLKGLTDTRSENSNERDVPLARSLHLLCRTVAESSLSNYTILFASHLSIVCFTYLKSSEWQIRNAALQLYGVLVPKLVGQALDTEQSMTADELFVHIPMLLQIIKEILTEGTTNRGNIIVQHSSLVPVLSLLSYMAKRFKIVNLTPKDYNEFHVVNCGIADLLRPLQKLLGSPIFVVRNMCAKIINILFDVDTIAFTKDISKENEVHGHLSLLKEMAKYYGNRERMGYNIEEEMAIIKRSYEHISKTAYTSKSYCVKQILFEIQNSLKINTKNDISDAIKINSFTKMMPGYFVWREKILQHFLIRCSEEELLETLDQISDNREWVLSEESVISILKTRISNEENEFSSATLRRIFEIMMSYMKISNDLNSDIFEFLYIISEKLTGDDLQNLQKHTHFLKSILSLENVLEKKQNNRSHLLPLSCRLSASEVEADEEISDYSVELSHICKILVNPRHFDAACRQIVAISIKHFIPHFHSTNLTRENVSIKNNILSAVIYLLQDEDDDVRMNCTKNFQIFKNATSQHSYHILLKILSSEFMLSTFHSSESALDFLKNIKKEITDRNVTSNGTDDFLNPFDHNISNAFWEPSVILNIITKIIDTVEKI